MKKFVKYLLFGVLTLAIGGLVTGCYGEDITDLQDRATSLEDRIDALERANTDLEQLRQDILAAQAAAEAAGQAASEAKQAADQAKNEAIKAAQEEIQKLLEGGAIRDMITEEVDAKMATINQQMNALGLRLDQVEDDVISNMIATLQLQKKVLQIFGGDEVATYITRIDNWIAGLKNGSVNVKDINLQELADQLADLDVDLVVLNLGEVVSIHLFPSYSAHAANILVKGLFALEAAQGGVIDWTLPAEELLADFFSWNPDFRELAGPLALDFAATRGVIDYNFGSGRIGGGVDGLPVASNSVPFQKDVFTNATETSFIVRVNPTNANLADAQNQIMFVRGDGDVNVNKYLDIVSVEKVTGDEALALTTRAIPGGGQVPNGLWKITVKLNDNRNEQGLGVVASDFDRLVTKYGTNGQPEKLVPEGVGADIQQYIDENIPEEYLYRKYLYAVAVTKKNDGDNFNPQKPLVGNIIASSYEVGIYPLDLEPVYNRHTTLVDNDNDNSTQEKELRLDEFKFSVTSDFAQADGERTWHHYDIHNRFEQTESPGATTPAVPWEFRWIDAYRERENDIYVYSIITPSIVGEMNAKTTTSIFVERDGLTSAELRNLSINTLGAPELSSTADRDAYNPYDEVWGVNHGDNRQVQRLFQVQAGTPFNITIDNAALVSHFYVALDTKWALESAPSELNAWNTYTYDGLNANHVSDVVSSEKRVTITVSGPNIAGDILGFRVFIVNYDGTLVDPDGKAFYVLVRGNTVGNEVINTVEWPTSPKWVTKNGAGNTGTPASDYVDTNIVPFTRPEGMSDADWNALRASLDGYDWELKISYNTPGNYWDVADNTLDNYIYSSKNDLGVNFRRLTSGGATATSWANTAQIAYDLVNPRGITDNSQIQGKLTFYREMLNGDPMLDPEEYIVAEWNMIIKKIMPLFPEDASYKTNVLKGRKFQSGDNLGVADPSTANGQGYVLWAYPTRQMWNNIHIPHMSQGWTWTPDPNVGWVMPDFPAGQDGNTGNYNYYSSIWFGQDSDAQDESWWGEENTATAAANYPNPATEYFAGLRFVPTSSTPRTYYGSGSGEGLVGFINHDMRVHGEDIGLNDPVDRSANGTPLDTTTFTNEEVSYNGKTARSGAMATHEARLTWGWGYISHRSNTDNLYWADAAQPETGNSVRILNEQYPIFVRFRSFIQDLTVIESELPDLIYNAEEIYWETTEVNDITVISLTGTEFPIEYTVPATYINEIEREYTVVDVSIWTVDPKTGVVTERRNEFFNPMVPSEAEYANLSDVKANDNNIVWVPVSQQDTPDTVQGVVTFDIQDEFGHVYRMKMDQTITMRRAQL